VVCVKLFMEMNEVRSYCQCDLSEMNEVRSYCQCVLSGSLANAGGSTDA
jgi:hypothetical protein